MHIFSLISMNIISKGVVKSYESRTKILSIFNPIRMLLVPYNWGAPVSLKIFFRFEAKRSETLCFRLLKRK
jgi:hypothetical protein